MLLLYTQLVQKIFSDESMIFNRSVALELLESEVSKILLGKTPNPVKIAFVM
jgi:hypothetical protein